MKRWSNSTVKSEEQFWYKLSTYLTCWRTWPCTVRDQDKAVRSGKQFLCYLHVLHSVVMMWAWLRDRAARSEETPVWHVCITCCRQSVTQRHSNEVYERVLVLYICITCCGNHPEKAYNLWTSLWCFYSRFQQTLFKGCPNIIERFCISHIRGKGQFEEFSKMVSQDLGYGEQSLQYIF